MVVSLLLLFVGLCAAEVAESGELGVVQGTPVSASEYPWIAALRIADDDGCGNTRSFLCGASIFDVSTNSKRWVLTAGHCLANAQNDINTYNNYWPQCNFALYVDVSRNNIADTFEQDYQVLRCDGFRLHEHYGGPGNNDIAIAWSSDYLYQVTPVQLASANPCCNAGDQLRVLGYGRSSYNGQMTEHLEYADLHFVTWSDCKSDWYGLNSGIVCAQGTNGRDSCQGDSGGPLIKGTSQYSKQVGIVSGGRGCGDTFPALYTDVGYYRYWISSNMNTVYYGVGSSNHTKKL